MKIQPISKIRPTKIGFQATRMFLIAALGASCGKAPTIRSLNDFEIRYQLSPQEDPQLSEIGIHYLANARRLPDLIAACGGSQIQHHLLSPQQGVTTFKATDPKISSCIKLNMPGLWIAGPLVE